MTELLNYTELTDFYRKEAQKKIIRGPSTALGSTAKVNHAFSLAPLRMTGILKAAFAAIRAAHTCHARRLSLTTIRFIP